VAADFDKSIGDEATLAGKAKRRPASEVSLGDERTLGDGRSGQDTVIDDIEVVDLEARYKVEGTLGQGGMGAVLLATDTRLDRKVAIKRILGEAAGNRMAVQRFLTEAKAIAALNHPNVVQIYDYGRAKDGPFLIMEFVDGGSLLDRCRESALPLDEAIDLACQLCDGLAKAHDLGIIHRDIKPANVLLSKEEIPKLTDFGLAKSQAGDHGQTMTGAVLGTPDFMPPEQRRDASLVDHRSDIWSLAATLYQMVTGRSPKIIRFDLLPPGLTSVLGKALEDGKESRYQSAREFRDALKTSLVASASAAAELGEGQCPTCAVKNDSSRRFCRGCGESLEAPCLSCSKPMPMWEEICGQCGTKQAPLLENRRGEMAAQQAEAQGLLKDYDFDEAERLTVSLRDESDPRLKQLVSWATDFVAKIGKARDAQLAQAGERLAEALKHEASFDYPSAAHVLEQVPGILRSRPLVSHAETVAAALARVAAKQSDVEKLQSSIKARIDSQAISGLLPDVERLRKLRPDRADVDKLRAQLAEREHKLAAQRDEAIVLARQHLDAKDYQSAMAVMRKVDRSVETPEMVRLRDTAETSIKRLQELLREISQAVSQKQLDNLMPKVQAALAIQPGHVALTKLRETLQVRESKAADDIRARVSQADAAFKACQFDKATVLLQRIPTDRRNSDVKDLLERCEHLATVKADVLAGFNGLPQVPDLSAVEGIDLKGLAFWGRSYLGELATHGLDDQPIQQLCRKCEAANEKREAALEVARRVAANVRRIFIYTYAAAAAILLVAVGLWARSSMRARALEQAVADGRWNDALVIAPLNPKALVGRARQRLQANPVDINGAFADLEEAARQPADVDIAQAVRSEAHAVRAAAEARAGRLERASEDLQAATRGNADQALIMAAKAAIVDALIARVEQAAANGDGTGIRSASEKALAAGADRVAVTELWQKYVNGRIAKLDVEGIELASRELKKAGLNGPNEAEWWIRFGATAAGPPHENAAEMIRAVGKAIAAGAAESVVAPLRARVIVLEALASLSKGDTKNAVSGIMSASLMDAVHVEQVLKQPKYALLRERVLVEYRGQLDAAVAGKNWTEALRVASTAGTIANAPASWVGDAVGAMPSGVLASFSREAFAGLTTISEKFEKPSSGLYSRIGDPRVNGVESNGGVSFFRMTSGHDQVIARGEPYAVYFPIIFSPTDSKTIEVSFRCRRFVQTPEGEKSFLAVELVDAKADVNAALAGARLPQRVTIYNNDRFSQQKNGYAVIGVQHVEGGRVTGGVDGHAPCKSEQEWMKVTLWLKQGWSVVAYRSGEEKRRPIIDLWTFVNGVRPFLPQTLLVGEENGQPPEHLGICFIAYGSKKMNIYGQREPVQGEAEGCVYDIADVAFRLIDPPTRAAETMEACFTPQ
jgi:hypothetical protein